MKLLYLLGSLAFINFPKLINTKTFCMYNMHLDNFALSRNHIIKVRILSFPKYEQLTSVLGGRLYLSHSTQYTVCFMLLKVHIAYVFLLHWVHSCDLLFYSCS